MLLDGLGEVFEHMVGSTKPKGLNELLAGLTLFRQVPKRHGIFE